MMVTLCSHPPPWLLAPMANASPPPRKKFLSSLFLLFPFLYFFVGALSTVCCSNLVQ